MAVRRAVLMTPPMTLLTSRLHVDLQRTSSAGCSPA